MHDIEAFKRGMKQYGPRINVTEASCQCGHTASGHNAKGQGNACDKCNCGMFHGVGDAAGRPQPQ